MALANMCICADSLVPLLFENVISTKLSSVVFKFQTVFFLFCF